MNVGDNDYQPLFAYGYGLSHGDSVSLPALPENLGLPDNAEDAAGRIIELGDPGGYWRMNLKDESGDNHIGEVRGASPAGHLTVFPADHEIQEDTFIATWSGSASLIIEGQPENFQPQANENQALELNYQVLQADVSRAIVAMGEGSLDLTAQFVAKSAAGWQTALIPLSCFVDQGASMEMITRPLVISANGSLKLQVASARLAANPADANCDL